MHATILWYASLDSGYDDYSVTLFEEETGIKAPVDATAPDRFSKRHAFLAGPQRDKWVAWRCRKIHELNCRINSVYPEDGFWWDSQLRITPPFQAGDHFLEGYAHALAELDALRITRGGLFLDKAHSDQIRRFGLAYRSLPAKKFETVGATTDPVTVRTLVDDGCRYVYLVNREYYPVSVGLKLGKTNGKATDLATGQPVDAPAIWRITLGPYDLRSFALPQQAEVEGFTVAPPEDIERQLKTAAQDTLAMIESLEKAKQPLPNGTKTIVAGIKSAVEEGRLAWLRRALHSYPIRKARQIPAK